MEACLQYVICLSFSNIIILAIYANYNIKMSRSIISLKKENKELRDKLEEVINDNASQQKKKKKASSNY